MKSGFFFLNKVTTLTASIGYAFNTGSVKNAVFKMGKWFHVVHWTGVVLFITVQQVNGYNRQMRDGDDHKNMQNFFDEGRVTNFLFRHSGTP